MVFGGNNPGKHKENATVIKVGYKNGTVYEVPVTSMKIEGAMMDLEDLSMIIDSGTTHSFFPKTNLKKILRKIRKYCRKGGDHCGGNKEYSEKICFEVDRTKFKTEEEFLATFPTMEVALGGQGWYEWKASEYLIKTSNPYDASGFKYCNGLLPTQDGSNPTLGLNFMRHHEFHFNRNDLSLEIHESDCN